ncbi:MAG TPA: hypothetical protein VFV54_04890, partial [Thermoanaerobaculia bacterium]|nr:hypothetical protein [Thermoanaerobaculia bacterium]
MPSLRRIPPLLAFALFALAAGPRADASTLVVPADSSLSARADIIVIGRVVETRAVDRNGKIWTESTVAVNERLKGSSPDVVTLREPGGILGARMSVVFG